LIPTPGSNTKPRIIHIVAYAVRGGCETCCAVFIRHAPDFDHNVVVLGSSGPMSGYWEALGAKVSHHSLLEKGWWSFQREVRGLVRTMPADGVIVWTGVRVPIVLAALSGIGCPVALHAGNPFHGGWRVRLLLVASGWLAPRPQFVRVIACSEHVARTYRKAPYFDGFPIEACFNPIEIPAANPHAARALDPSGPARIGMVARLDPIKDHATLIRAFARLHSRRTRVELLLAGDGELRNSLEALARDLGVSESVRFLGAIGEVPAFLSSLDLFCYITTEREGMGNALAEAMAHGLPCLVNDLPVMREVAGKDGDSVRFTQSLPSLVERGIEELLGDAPKRQRLSEAAWRRARDAFAPGRVVRAYLSALQFQP
jgi:glycosyltransferase involved in cell wall biosynthesis